MFCDVNTHHSDCIALQLIEKQKNLRTFLACFTRMEDTEEEEIKEEFPSEAVP